MITTPPTRRAKYNLRSRNSTRKSKSYIFDSNIQNQPLKRKKTEHNATSVKKQILQKQNQQEAMETDEPDQKQEQNISWQPRVGGSQCKLIVFSGVENFKSI